MFKLFSALRRFPSFQTPALSYYFAEVTVTSPFSVKSVIGHKAPSALEENIPSRYASVLFSIASKNEALHLVMQDAVYLKELSLKSEPFKNFLVNLSLKRHEQNTIMETLGGKEAFSTVTVNFLSTIIDNKQLDSLAKILDKYIEFYKILNDEQTIRIISADELSKEQRDRVVASLKKANPDLKFNVRYEIEPTILGGLQMYNGNNFLDCSLLSRVQRVKSELSRLS